MPNLTDLPAGHELWTEQEQNLYNKLPIYMEKIRVEKMQWYSRITKLLNVIPWQANKGTTMQGVRKVESPVRRQMALPNQITSPAKRDVEEVRETSEKMSVYHQKFESNLFHFVPSFQDFLTDHIDFSTDNLTKKIMIYVEQFYRTAIFHGAPRVWVCGKAPGTELTETEYWDAPTIALAKTQANIQALINQVQKTLDFRQCLRISSTMFEDLRILPYSGSVLGDGSDGSALKGKYAFTSASGVYDMFHDDPYVLDNKDHNLDIITNGFRGSIAGRLTHLSEDYELRIAADGSFPAPEAVEEGADTYNLGEPNLSPEYVNAPFAVAFFWGAEGYKAARIGAAPKEFARGEMSMKQFRAMNLNGEVKLTKDVMIPVPNEDGTTVYDTNKYGEYAQLIAHCAMGILPVQRRNVIPVIYRRARVGAD